MVGDQVSRQAHGSACRHACSSLEDESALTFVTCQVRCQSEAVLWEVEADSSDLLLSGRALKLQFPVRLSRARPVEQVFRVGASSID